MDLAQVALLVMSPSLARKPLAIFDCIETPPDEPSVGSAWVLRDDPSQACFDGQQWSGWAAAASLGVLADVDAIMASDPMGGFLLGRWLKNSRAVNQTLHRMRARVLLHHGVGAVKSEPAKVWPVG